MPVGMGIDSGTVIALHGGKFENGKVFLFSREFLPEIEKSKVAPVKIVSRSTATMQ